MRSFILTTFVIDHVLLNDCSTFLFFLTLNTSYAQTHKWHLNEKLEHQTKSVDVILFQDIWLKLFRYLLMYSLQAGACFSRTTSNPTHFNKYHRLLLLHRRFWQRITSSLKGVSELLSAINQTWRFGFSFLCSQHQQPYEQCDNQSQSFMTLINYEW